MYLGPYLETPLPENMDAGDLELSIDQSRLYIHAEDSRMVRWFISGDLWRGRRLGSDFRDQENGSMSVTAVEVQLELEAFKIDYARTISTIEARTGPGVVKWGLLFFTC